MSLLDVLFGVGFMGESPCPQTTLFQQQQAATYANSQNQPAAPVAETAGGPLIDAEFYEVESIKMLEYKKESDNG